MGNRDGNALAGPVDVDIVRAEGGQVDAGFQVGRAAEEDLPVPDLVPGAVVVGLHDLAHAVFDQAELLHCGDGLDFPLHGILHGRTAVATGQGQEDGEQQRDGMEERAHLDKDTNLFVYLWD